MHYTVTRRNGTEYRSWPDAARHRTWPCVVQVIKDGARAKPVRCLDLEALRMLEDKYARKHGPGARYLIVMS